MLKLYNTLSRKKEIFNPLSDNTVKMYSCGPTVYNFAHIGNMRTYVFMDILRRTLKFCGYKLKGVMNVTDVGHLLSDSDDGEDKMEVAARKQQKSVKEIADTYAKAFFEDLEKLNIEKPEIIAYATEHIKEMIEYVKELQKAGYAYEISDGIYFDTSKFKDYGKLSGIDIENQLAGARVEVNDEKRNSIDFALWKKADPNHIMQWESPWGMGYPGWHIECSAMSRKYLGMPFDIHTGGVDHIPIHHENEIAQNEALTKNKSVNFWMHGEFMLVDNGKMSKSLNNTYTISDLKEKGYSAMDFRYFCLNTHYRKKLNFTFDSMNFAKTSYRRLKEQLLLHKNSKAVTDKKVIEEYKEKFKNAVEDDLNIPLALGILWTMLKEEKSKDIYDTAIYFDKVLGLNLDKEESEEKPQPTLPQEITELAEKRKKAKAEKNFALADSLRNEIENKGYSIIDKPGCYEIIKK